MKKSILFVVCLIISISEILLSQPGGIVNYKGNVIDGGKILVSSYGICPDGYAISYSSWYFQFFFSTWPAISGITYDDAPELDWAILPYGTQPTFDVWIDSFPTLIAIIGNANEGCRLPAGEWFYLNGYCSDKFYLRKQAGLSGWTTVYYLRTKEER